jgi:hypothetical protein
MASIQGLIAKRLYSHLVLGARSRTTDLRLEALMTGWPEELANSLTVRVTADGGYVVQYPESLKHSILTQEFGDENTPPSPVIRNFMTSVGN